MGLITDQYEKLIDLNAKLKLLKNFITINEQTITAHPEILSKFDLHFSNIILKFNPGENKTINLIVCDKDGFVLHVINNIRSIEHFYYEGTLLLKLQSYENWTSTSILNSKTGLIKRLAMPISITRKPNFNSDSIVMMKRPKTNPTNRDENATPLTESLEKTSRFNKLFDL